MTKSIASEITKPARNLASFWQGIIVFIVSFIIYSNSLPNDFNIDDALYTTELNTVSNKGIDAFKEIFTTHTFHEGDVHYEYRPLTMLTFAIQHQFIGSEASKSHFINLLLYAFTCWVIFRLLRKWFRDTGGWFAFFVAILFAVHPLHTEIVDNIKSRDELLSMLLGVCSLLFLWKGIETGKKLWFVLSPLALLAAFLSKTTVMPLLILFPLSLYYFSSLKLKNVIITCLPVLLVMVVFASIYFSLPTSARHFEAYENPLYIQGLGIGDKVAISFYMMGWYLYLHLIPHPLVFFYGYQHVPVVSLSNTWVLLSILLYTGIIIMVIKGIKKKTPFSFGGILYLCSILLFANPFLAAPGGMAERFAYASSLGFCIMICSILYTSFKIELSQFSFSMQGGKRVAIIFFSAGAVFAAKTIARNPDWKDRATLYSHDIEYLENSAKANLLYGEYLLGKVTEYKQKAGSVRDAATQRYFMDSAVYYHNTAKKHLLAALEISPEYGTAVNNMAVVYFQEDSIAKARQYLFKANKLTPGNVDIIYNIGMIYALDHMEDSAVSYYQQAITVQPKYMQAYKSLSDLYLAKKDTLEAINILLSGAHAAPENAAPYGELANIALLKNDTLQAVAYCEQAVELKGAPPAMIYFLESYFTMKGNSTKAQYYRGKLSAAPNGDM